MDAGCEDGAAPDWPLDAAVPGIGQRPLKLLVDAGCEDGAAPVWAPDAAAQ